MGKDCYKVLMLVVLLKERLSENMFAGISWKNLIFVYCVMLALEPPPSVCSWWQEMRILPLSCFSSFHWLRKVELGSFILTCGSRHVFPLVTLWLLHSCYHRGAGGAVWVWEPLCPCTWDVVALGSFCTDRLENRLWLSEMLPAMAVVCCYRFINFSWSLKWQCRNTEMKRREEGVIICLFSLHFFLGICS